MTKNSQKECSKSGQSYSKMAGLFAFLFRIKLNYKISENNCRNIWRLQNNVVYL